MLTQNRHHVGNIFFLCYFDSDFIVCVSPSLDVLNLRIFLRCVFRDADRMREKQAKKEAAPTDGATGGATGGGDSKKGKKWRYRSQSCRVSLGLEGTQEEEEVERKRMDLWMRILRVDALLLVNKPDFCRILRLAAVLGGMFPLIYMVSPLWCWDWVWFWIWLSHHRRSSVGHCRHDYQGCCSFFYIDGQCRASYETTCWRSNCGTCDLFLTHWGWDKMAAILQTTLSNAFCLNENVRILIKISLKFVPKGPIDNTPALVQIMAWRRPGDKPLSEAMMVRLLTHIYASFSLNELLKNMISPIERCYH